MGTTVTTMETTMIASDMTWVDANSIVLSKAISDPVASTQVIEAPTELPRSSSTSSSQTIENGFMQKCSSTFSSDMYCFTSISGAVVVFMLVFCALSGFICKR